MSDHWSVHTIGRIYSNGTETGLADGRWVRSVAEPYHGGRLRAAWEVFTGRAYAFRWPEPGELEEAIEPEQAP